MGHYLSTTPQQLEQMLQYVGVDSTDAFYRQAPSHLLLKDGLRIPSGKSELEVSRMMEGLAGKNTVFPSIFRGAGAYRHYIPAAVSAIVSKETFVTAYTPYQAELSQGLLQSIFEYQTMICQLTGMDVSNASVYDGATAAAEAVAMCRERKRTKAYVSACTHPDVIETIRTYCWASGTDLLLIPTRDGITDLDALENMLDENAACVYLQQPNYCGILEDCVRAGEIAHAAGARFIMGVQPIAAAILKTPGECGADIAVGEGQPLGIPLAFGGPYLGFMAATADMTRRLPGRIAGQTTDSEGNRAFVLTLQAREQHIRREKASSNICSNQALCAMTAAVYMAIMGPQGMMQAAEQCLSKAHYLAAELERVGFPRKHDGEFFQEFVTTCPGDREGLLRHLMEKEILGGLPVEDGLLWCVTELNTKEEMDELVREVAQWQKAVVE